MGPLRRCIAAKTFRSNNVKNAIDKINGNIIGKNLNQSRSKIKSIKKTSNLIKNKIIKKTYNIKINTLSNLKKK